MINPYLPKLAKVLKIKQTSAETKLFVLQYVDKTKFEFSYGQFVQVGIFGFGEAPFSLCSATTQKETFEILVRAIGDLTNKLHQLKTGELVTVRGPFGNGFPLDKFKNKNILLVGGGCGFVPLRSFILDHLAGKFNPKNKMQVFYGCQDEKNILFADEHARWKKVIDLQIALLKPPAQWRGIRGVVTKIFEKVEVLDNALAVIVGPPVMYKFVIEELKKSGLTNSDIYLSLERRMYCGLGVCQHCAIGPYYVCKDGPVFSYEQLKTIREAI